MPATFTHKPAKEQRKEPGHGGQPPPVRRPTGGGGNGDDNWGNQHRGPRELLLRIRFFVFSALAADMLFFAVMVMLFFARQAGTHMDPRTHEQIGDWHPVALPPILFLNTAALLVSCLTMELARRNIFREIDALEEWLGLGRPALNRALPWLGATLALGSALALFLYPRSLTAILSASSGRASRRNAALLPGYSFMLGLLALLGFFVIAAGVHDLPAYAAGFKTFGNNFAVPALLLQSFPSWFVGIAFAAIGIGALVPAAIMSIAAANLYTRNIHREFINKNPTDKQEAQNAKWVSLLVKLGALVFILFVPTKYAIQLQLLGGIWMIQTLPAVMLGAYTRRFNAWALLIGWAVGTCLGTSMAIATNLQNSYPLSIGSYTFPGYTAVYTVVVNVVLAAALTPLFNRLAGSDAADETRASDYLPS